jgi:hypothetical protein
MKEYWLLALIFIGGPIAYFLLSPSKIEIILVPSGLEKISSDYENLREALFKLSGTWELKTESGKPVTLYRHGHSGIGYHEFKNDYKHISTQLIFYPKSSENYILNIESGGNITSYPLQISKLTKHSSHYTFKVPIELPPQSN